MTLLIAVYSSACAVNGRGALSAAGLTKLGYFPAYPSRWTDTLEYDDVRKWAEAVADGYDTRATLNRYSLYLGAFVGAAAAGAVAGLGAFSPGSPAITGIPIGTAFLGSVAAYYQNKDRAHIYDAGAQAVAELIALADQRLDDVDSGTPAKAGNLRRCVTRECVTNCLANDVQAVIGAVKKQIHQTDPETIGKDMKALLQAVKDTPKVADADKQKIANAAVAQLTAEFILRARPARRPFPMPTETASPIHAMPVPARSPTSPPG